MSVTFSESCKQTHGQEQIKSQSPKDRDHTLHTVHNIKLRNSEKLTQCSHAENFLLLI